MKHFTLHCPVRAIIFLACPFMALPLAQAQTQPVEMQPAGSEAAIQAQWNKLQQANSRITAAHVVWRRVQRINPIPDADPEKWAAAALAAARENGMTEEQAQQQAQSERREAVRSKQERVVNSTLDFTRIGTSVLCNIEHPDPDYRSRAIEFSDGTDALFAWTQVKGREEDRKDGNLTRDLSDRRVEVLGGWQPCRSSLAWPSARSKFRFG